MISIGIVGGAGYTAGELLRLLVNHPNIKIDFVYSTSNAGNPIHDVHQDLLGTLAMEFTDSINAEVDVLFLCLGHGNSKQFLKDHHISEHTKIIDLSNDFRLTADHDFEGRQFVYGLPELQRERITSAKHIANPGCFATAIQLALLPLAEAQLLADDVHVNAVTGSTGAGTSLSSTTHFTWRDNNVSSYKVFQHQHLGEIYQSIAGLQQSFTKAVHFIPNRGNFSRGIFATAYTKYQGSLAEAQELYESFYKEAAFTFVSEKEIHLKQVVNTNKCLIHLYKQGDQLVITSIIDNLVKGASGQAIQNMNLICGFDEMEGLRLKASYF